MDGYHYNAVPVMDCEGKKGSPPWRFCLQEKPKESACGGNALQMYNNYAILCGINATEYPLCSSVCLLVETGVCLIKNMWTAASHVVCFGVGAPRPLALWNSCAKTHLMGYCSSITLSWLLPYYFDLLVMRA